MACERGGAVVSEVANEVANGTRPAATRDSCDRFSSSGEADPRCPREGGASSQLREALGRARARRSMRGLREPPERASI